MTWTGSLTSGGSSRTERLDSVMRPWTPAAVGQVDLGHEPDDLAVLLDLGAPGAADPRHDRQAPPEGEQDVVVGVARRGRAGPGGCARPVAYLDARVVAGAAQPHAHRLLGVQQRVGDHLGDTDAGRLDRARCGRSPSAPGSPTAARRRRHAAQASGPEQGGSVACRTPGQGGGTPISGSRTPLKTESNTFPSLLYRPIGQFHAGFRGATPGRTSRTRARHVPGGAADIPRTRRENRDVDRGWVAAAGGGRSDGEETQIRRRGEAWHDVRHIVRHRHAADSRTPPGGGHRLGVRRAVRDQGPQARRRRRHPDRADQPSPLPAAALPGRDRHLVPGRDRAVHARDPQPPAERQGAARRGHRRSTSRPGPSPPTCSAAGP